MDELITQALKGLVASGPLACALIYALRYQTQRLEKFEERIEQLHDEKEALYEKVLDTMREVSRD